MSNRSINAQSLRPYKVEVFGLQDNYIGTLQSFDDTFLGQILEPRLTIKDDGTQTFTCRIPKFYIDPKTNSRVTNPRWMDTEGDMLAENIRVLKIFVNVGDKPEDSLVYPMIVNKVSDRRDSHFSVYRSVEASGLAFAELGKQGYKLELNAYTIESENEEASKTAEESGGNVVFIEPTINYWLDKVFPWEPVKNEKGDIIGTKWLTPWCYEIRMDYGYYAEARESTKVYEDSYVNDWTVSANDLIPAGVEPFKEKARYIDCQNSNKYNITQTIAENFGVFCRYEYKTDLNGKFVKEWTDENNKVWTGKKVVFYNKAIKTENPYVIDYQKNLQTIERISEGGDIYTKLYVKPIESSAMSNGYVTIADVVANPSYDEFILNFDYLNSIGAVSSYQLGRAKDYLSKIRDINLKMAANAPMLEHARVAVTEREAELAALEKQIEAAESNATRYGDLLAPEAESVERKWGYPCRLYILKHTEKDAQGEDVVVGYYLNFSAYTAVDVNSIKGFLDRPGENSTPNEDKGDIDVGRVTIASKITSLPSIENPLNLEKRHYRYYCNPETGHVERLYLPNSKEYLDILTKYFDNNTESNTDDDSTWKYYALFTYHPDRRYENIVNDYNTLKDKLLKTKSDLFNTTGTKGSRNILNEAQDAYSAYLTIQNNLIAKKEALNIELENLLGPALREGYWNPNDDYSATRRPYAEMAGSGAKGNTTFYWDKEPKLGEESLFFYKKGVDTETIYRKYIELSALGNDADKDFTSLSFTFKEKDGEDKTTLYYGSSFEAAFINSGAERVLVFTFDSFTWDSEYDLSNVEYSFTNDDKVQTGTIKLNDDTLKTATASTKQVWPRIRINQKNVQYNAESMKLFKTVSNGNETSYEELRRYYDYYYHIEDGYPCYTLKFTSNNLMEAIGVDCYKVEYEVSTANEMLYLDARQVAKDNSIPRYSYSLTLSNLPHDFKHIDLSQLVYINDYSLGIHAATGYVNEITYHLDEPWEDEINVQNYKTKFEDLFNTIVAQSEAMKNSQPAITNVVNNFEADGTLKSDLMQGILNNNEYYFNYSASGVTITPDQGIILENKLPYSNGVKGQVVLKGGGIFLSSECDANGDRIWSTAITPEGINANVLNAGQINTELIQIYSGKDPTFKWDKTGIHAYCEDSNGGYNQNKFVLFSKEGLQCVNDGKNRVSLTWAGLNMFNDEGAHTFKLDTKGNIQMSGTLQSFDYIEGPLGRGWKIDQDGHAYFNDVDVRGTISASVFKYDETTAVGGRVYVAPTLISTEASRTTCVLEFNNDTSDRLFFKFSTPLAGGKSDYAGRVWKRQDKIQFNGSISNGRNVYTIKNLQMYLSHSTFDNNGIPDPIMILARDGITTNVKNLFYKENGALATEKEVEEIVTNITTYTGIGDWYLIFSGTKEGEREGIMITAMEENSPYIDIYDDANTMLANGPVVRLGKLDGLDKIPSIANYFGEGKIKGYGLYSDNVYLTGAIYATSGKIGSLSIDQLENKQLKINVDLGNEKNFIINKKTGTNVNDSEKPTVFVKAYIDNEYLAPGTKVGEGLLEPFSNFNFQYQYYDPETEKWNNFSATSSPISWEKGYNETGKTDCALTASVNVILTRQYRTVITVTYKNNNETQTIYSQPYMFSLVEDGNNGEDGDNGKDSVIYTITPDITTITRDLVTSISPTSFSMIANKVSGAITEKIKVTHTDSYRIVVFAVRPGTNGTVSYEAINPKGGGAKGYDANVTTGNKSSIPSLTLTNYFAKGQDYGDAIALILRLYNFSGLGTNATYTDATLLTQTTVNFTLGEDLRALGTLSADKKEVLVADGKVTANSIVAGAITAGKLSAGAISTGVISGSNEIYIMAGEGTNYNKAPSFDAKSWTPYSGATALTWTTGDKYAEQLKKGFQQIWDNKKYTTGVKIDGTGVYIQGTNSKLVVDMTNFKIDSSGNVTINGVINAKNGGTIGGWNIGSSTIYSGDVNADVDPNYVCLFGGSSSEYSFYAGGRHGIDAKFWVKKDGSIKATSGTIGEWTITTGKLHSGTANDNYVALGTSGDYRIWAGKKDAASAPFSVTKKGELKASSGTIGGWKLDTARLYAGGDADKNYVALNVSSSDDKDYVMWAGMSDPTSKDTGFAVTRQGTVYLRSIMAKDNEGGTGNPKIINLYDNWWKVNCALRAVSATPNNNGTVTLTFQRWGATDLTVNFKRAASGELDFSGSGTSISVKIKDGNTTLKNETLTLQLNPNTTSWEQHSSSSFAEVLVSSTGERYGSLSLQPVYQAGQKSVTLTKGSWSNGTVYFTTNTGLENGVSLSQRAHTVDGNDYYIPIEDAASATPTGFSAKATSVYNAGYEAGWKAAAKASSVTRSGATVTSVIPSETKDKTTTINWEASASVQGDTIKITIQNVGETFMDNPYAKITWKTY